MWPWCVKLLPVRVSPHLESSLLVHKSHGSFQIQNSIILWSSAHPKNNLHPSHWALCRFYFTSQCASGETRSPDSPQCLTSHHPDLSWPPLTACTPHTGIEPTAQSYWQKTSHVDIVYVVWEVVRKGYKRRGEKPAGSPIGGRAVMRHPGNCSFQCGRPISSPTHGAQAPNTVHRATCVALSSQPTRATFLRPHLPDGEGFPQTAQAEPRLAQTFLQRKWIWLEWTCQQETLKTQSRRTTRAWLRSRAEAARPPCLLQGPVEGESLCNSLSLADFLLNPFTACSQCAPAPSGSVTLSGPLSMALFASRFW